jgi:excisionase family DNA binding protein
VAYDKVGERTGKGIVEKEGDLMSKMLREKTVAQAAGSVAETRSSGSGQTEEIKITINDVQIVVSPELEDAVHRAYKGLLRPLPKEMTTNQVAEFLDVSRPFVIKLIKRGELPCRMVGKHRRIPSGAAADYRDKMFQQARTAADEMAQMSQDAGLYDEELPRKVQ